MDYIEKKIGNADFTFCLNSHSNRSGFVHECDLYMDGRHLASSKAQYYNRTWESYRFQTVMHSAVRNAIDDARERIEDAEKYQRGWKKLTAARREEINAIIEQNSGVKVLNALMDAVDRAKYGTESERKELEFLDAMLAVVEVLCGKREASA